MSVTTDMLEIFVPKFGSLEDVDTKSLYFKASALPKKYFKLHFWQTKKVTFSKSEMRLEFT